MWQIFSASILCEWKLNCKLKWLNFTGGECSANNDPHFETFDKILFDWHGHYTYVLSQEGCDRCPDSFVYSLLVDCATGSPWATCVQTVYFQPEPNTTIQIVKADQIIKSNVSICYIKLLQICIGSHANKIKDDI